LTALTVQEKLELVTRHVECELREDWDGTFATMIDEPFYVHYPAGLRVSGREAVLQQWKLLVGSSNFTDAVTSSSQRFWAVGDSVVTTFQWTIDQGESAVILNSYAVFTFADGLIESETIFADGQTESILNAALGGEFLQLSGVEDLEELHVPVS
jgi:SnoaL-like protein